MQDQAKPKFTFIAVHGGAGFHSKSKDSEIEIRRCLTRAVTHARTSLDAGATALNVTEKAIIVLEDDPCLNAGYGSNLTFDGTVECDASIMDGLTMDYGAVGAVPGVKNPIQAAFAVFKYSKQPDPLGRIPPILLVSEGARAFAEENQVACVDSDTLRSPRSQDEWRIWRDRFDSSAKAGPGVSSMAIDREGLHDRQDTVGAIALDSSGGLAAGVSSGGLLLKPSGRIGEAAMFGAGCWAQQVADRGIACSISGSGEYIARMMLAKTVGEAILADSDPDVHEILEHTLGDFYAMCRDRGETEPSTGILLVVQEPGEDGESIARLWCAFTTESMAIAYGSSTGPKIKATILRRDSEPFQRDKDKPSICITSLAAWHR
ncbi:nucleophile aminohydrolase [Irpex lacteus]|nr:nucleophile aminohydrolase [Irpex lacteus]